MNMLNPQIHIICGRCGCNNELDYYLTIEVNDDTYEKETKVVINCSNCGTQTYLDELIKEKK